MKQMNKTVVASIAVLVLLVAMGVMYFGDFKTKGKMRTVGSDLAKLEAAFKAYRETNGQYPPNVDTGITPEGMNQYANYFENPTPVGGKYDWEGPDSWGLAAISIQKPDVGIGGLVTLDEAVDDGKLYTGKFRVINNNYFWVIEEKQ